MNSPFSSMNIGIKTNGNISTFDVKQQPRHNTSQFLSFKFKNCGRTSCILSKEEVQQLCDVFLDYHKKSEIHIIKPSIKFIDVNNHVLTYDIISNDNVESVLNYIKEKCILKTIVNYTQNGGKGTLDTNVNEYLQNVVVKKELYAEYLARHIFMDKTELYTTYKAPPILEQSSFLVLSKDFTYFFVIQEPCQNQIEHIDFAMFDIQICEFLNLWHQKAVHKDITQRNIVFCSMRYKVIDFADSVKLDDEDKLKITGSYISPYISPLQFFGCSSDEYIQKLCNESLKIANEMILSNEDNMINQRLIKNDEYAYAITLWTLKENFTQLPEHFDRYISLLMTSKERVLIKGGYYYNFSIHVLGGTRIMRKRYEDRTVKELRLIAKKKKIIGYYNLNKYSLIQALRNKNKGE